MDQTSLLNSALITFTLRVHTICSLSSTSLIACACRQAADWLSNWSKVLVITLLCVYECMYVCVCQITRTFPLPNPLLPEVSVHLQRHEQLVLNYKQVCFLPSFVLLIIPWAHTVHNKGWNNKPLSCEETGK